MASSAFRVAVAGAVLATVATGLPSGAAPPRANGAGVLAVDVDHVLELEDRRPREEPSVAVDPADPRTVVVSSMQFSRTFSGSLISGYSPRGRIWLSRDGGRAYRAVADLPLQPGQAAVTFDPRLAWDPHGPLYAAYTSATSEYPKAPSSEDGLYLARSNEAGRHWQRLAHLEGRSCGGPSRPALAVDPDRGWVYVAWTHMVEPSCNGSPDLSKTEVFWARSTDRGAHFSKPVRVTDPGVSRMPSLSVLTDGTVLVSVVTGGVLSLGDPSCPGAQEAVQAFRYSPSGRLLTSSTPIPSLCIAFDGLFGNGAAYTPVEYPSVAVDPVSGAAVIAAAFENYSQGGIMTATSRDRGRTWTQQAVTGAPGTAGSMGALAVDARGRTSLAWLEVSQGGLYQPVLSRSGDDGGSWAAPVPLATLPSNGNSHPQSGYDLYGFGQYLGLGLGRDGVAHVAWPDLRPRGTDSQEVDVWTRDVPPS